MARYQVLEGMHIQNNPSNDPKAPEVVYRKGDIFENHREDLCERLVNKFAKVHDGERLPVHASNAILNHPKDHSGIKDLSLDQLKALAAEEEIDISRLTKHADILKTVQAKLSRT